LGDNYVDSLLNQFYSAAAIKIKLHDYALKSELFMQDNYDHKLHIKLIAM